MRQQFEFFIRVSGTRGSRGPVTPAGAPVIKKIIVDSKSVRIKRIIDGSPHVLRFSIDDSVPVTSGYFYHYFRSDSNIYKVSNRTHLLTITANGSDLNPASLHDQQRYRYLAPGETETEEPIDAEFVYTETGPFYARRVKRLLTDLARKFADNFNHSLPHLRGRSRNICHDLKTSEQHEREELNRYDNTANYWKTLLGYMWKKVDDFENALSVLTSEEKQQIDSIINTVNPQVHQTHDFYSDHDQDEWHRIHNDERKIYMCDENCAPDELIHDINAQHMEVPEGGGDPVLNESNAEGEFANYSVTQFKACHSGRYRGYINKHENIPTVLTPNPPDDATLTSFIVKDQNGVVLPFTTPFTPETSNPIAITTPATTSITIEVIPTYSGTTVTLPTSFATPILHNFFTVTVTAADGTTTKDYVVMVTRNPAE